MASNLKKNTNTEPVKLSPEQVAEIVLALKARYELISNSEESFYLRMKDVADRKTKAIALVSQENRAAVAALFELEESKAEALYLEHTSKSWALQELQSLFERASSVEIAKK